MINNYLVKETCDQQWIICKIHDKIIPVFVLYQIPTKLDNNIQYDDLIISKVVNSGILLKSTVAFITDWTSFDFLIPRTIISYSIQSTN